MLRRRRSRGPAKPGAGVGSGRLQLGLRTGAVLFALAALAVTWLSATTAPSGKDTFLRGMTVTCPTWGPIWGTEHMRQALQQLDPLGVEWISIHPYAHIYRDGRFRFSPAADMGFLARAVDITRAEKKQLFWKPHLSYWGSFEWRGEIEFGNDEAAWRRFFDGYRAFIVDQARFAEKHRLPLFAVGVELEATTHRPEWRSILAEVREAYSGRITYAANWDRLDKVPFWDQVDLIGVQAYFPLSELEDPPVQQLRAGWDRHLRQLEEFSARHGGRPVLFTEIGYNRAPNAAREPWAYRVEDTPKNRALRARLMDVALERLEAAPVVAGVFWWKWMPGPGSGRSNFSMRDPEAVESLRRHWTASP